VTDEPSGKQPKKLPERDDALHVPVPFDAAVKAALETKPPPRENPKPRKKRTPP
jgi:hypothetical protein